MAQPQNNLINEFYLRLFDVVCLEKALELSYNSNISQLEIPRYSSKDFYDFLLWISEKRNILTTIWNLPEQEKFNNNPIVYIGRFLRNIDLGHIRVGKCHQGMYALNKTFLSNIKYSQIMSKVDKAESLDFRNDNQKKLTLKQQKEIAFLLEKYRNDFENDWLITPDDLCERVKPKNDYTFIYGLFDPSLKIRKVVYIGQTKSPYKRLMSHILQPSTIKKLEWISHMVVRNVYPKMIILNEVPIKHSLKYEKIYIQVAHGLYNDISSPLNETMLNKVLLKL